MQNKHRLFAVILSLVILSAGAGGSVRAGVLEARGLIKARHRTILSSEISGRVVEIPYRPGASFQKGAVLVRFDCSLMEAEKERAAAGLDAARVKLDVHRRLEQLQSIGALDVALDEAMLAQRQAELRIASLAVNRCVIHAP
jgi:multidrug resistance efflux pump